MRHDFDAMPSRRIEAVVIGASAGGIDALLAILKGLTPATRAPILVVVHLPAGHDSRLPEVFQPRLQLRALEAKPGDTPAPGCVYFAPPDYHLLVEPDHSFSLSCEPPVNYSRPALDPLFESCAEAYGAGLLAVVLTGANEDGARGLARVRACGGLAVVQEPAEAPHAAMPSAALALAGADMVLPRAKIHELIAKLICP